jgi:predicted flap endonuclease-1-like 5' DNA nuclease
MIHDYSGSSSGMDVSSWNCYSAGAHSMTKGVPMIAPIRSFQHGLYRHSVDEVDEAVVTQFFRTFQAEVLLCPLVNRAYVLVDADDLAAATATALRAAPLMNRALVPMTAADLDRCIALAQREFAGINGVSEDLAANLVEQGLFSFRDLAHVSLPDLMAVGELTASQGRWIIGEARRRTRREV